MCQTSRVENKLGCSGVVVGMKIITTAVTSSLLALGLLGQAQASDDPSIQVEYAIAVAHPTASGRLGQSVKEVPDRDLRAALSSVEETEGPITVQFLERFVVTSENNYLAKAKGADVAIEQQAKVEDGGVHARIKIDLNGPNAIETTAFLPFGKTRLLGRSALFETNTQGATRSKLFYFVRARAISN